MTEITAKLASAKLNDEKGVADELAAKMFHTLGSHHLAIVDLQVVDRTEGVSDKQIVRLAVTQLEIMPEGITEDHARELMRSVYLKRQPEGLDGTDGQTTDDIIRQGKNTVLTDDPFDVPDKPAGRKKAPATV